MTIDNDTRTQDDDEGAQIAIALKAIELALHTPAGLESRWAIKDEGSMVFIGSVAPTAPDGFYMQTSEQYNVSIREDGWLVYMGCHSDHVDSIHFAPAEVAALYRFFSLLAYARLVDVKEGRL